MKKNNITKQITPCCLLPFSVMYWWVDNLILNSDSDREFIRNRISQSGSLNIDAWKVLINSGALESDSSLTKSEFLAWFDCVKKPSCDQLTLIIEGFKIGNYDPLQDYSLSWTIVDGYEGYGSKLLKKVTNIVGVTDIPNSLQDLIGKYYSVNGGFTTDKDLAIDFSEVKITYNDDFII